MAARRRQRWAVIVVNQRDQIQLAHRDLVEREARATASELRAQSIFWPASWTVLVVPER
jgi:hypothetical protein